MAGFWFGLSGAFHGLVLFHDHADLRVLADGFEAAVDEDADVALGLAGDFGDLDVGEAVGPEVEGFSLAFG